VNAQLAGRRLRLSEVQRRCLAGLGQRLGGAVLRDVAALVTPDTLALLEGLDISVRDLDAHRSHYTRRLSSASALLGLSGRSEQSVNNLFPNTG
jgi:hypothetical protein